MLVALNAGCFDPETRIIHIELQWYLHTFVQSVVPGNKSHKCCRKAMKPFQDNWDSCSWCPQMFQLTRYGKADLAMKTIVSFIAAAEEAADW